MPEVFVLASGEERQSAQCLLARDFWRGQLLLQFFWARRSNHFAISPESRFDPGNPIGQLKKRFLKGLLLVKSVMIFDKPVLPQESVVKLAN